MIHRRINNRTLNASSFRKQNEILHQSISPSTKYAADGQPRTVVKLIASSAVIAGAPLAVYTAAPRRSATPSGRGIGGTQ